MRGLMDKKGEQFGYLQGNILYDLEGETFGRLEGEFVINRQGNPIWRVVGDGVYTLDSSETIGFFGADAPDELLG
jgi:hypothetical protein